MSDYPIIGEYYYLRQFEDLLYDAVMLAYMAHDIDIDKDEHGYAFSLARASIIESLLLIESSANCCIASLDLSSKLYNDIDKMPALSKFEFFIKQIMPVIKFDRGCKEVQCIDELIALRNSYVHPKIKRQKFFKIEESAWDTNFGKTELLGIPKASKDLRKNHAVDVLKVVNDFFNKLFLDWCRFDNNTICHILLSGEEVKFPDCIGKTGGYTIDAVGSLDRAMAEWGINFQYLGKQP